MASKEQALTRSLAKRGFSAFVRDDANYTTNAPIPLRIRYVGTSTVTSVVVTAATGIVLTPASGSTVTVAFATQDTMGKVADFINQTPDWECKVLDALRSDASASTLVAGTISASTYDGVSYYDIESDTSTVPGGYTYRCTPNRHTDERKVKGSHRVHLREIRYNANVGTAAADKVQVWECKGTTETQVYSALSVDSTGSTNSDTSITWASGYGYLTGADGADLVVRVTDAASITDDTDGHLSVIGEYE